MPEILKTPDDRFVDLPGFEYTPHYIEIENLRVHYVDDGKNGREQDAKIYIDSLEGKKRKIVATDTYFTMFSVY